jgi:hypothetical protein
VSPVAGPRDINVSSLSLWKISLPLVGILIAIRDKSSSCYKFSAVEIACFLWEK